MSSTRHQIKKKKPVKSRIGIICRHASRKENLSCIASHKINTAFKLSVSGLLKAQIGSKTLTELISKVSIFKHFFFLLYYHICKRLTSQKLGAFRCITEMMRAS